MYGTREDQYVVIVILGSNVVFENDYSVPNFLIGFSQKNVQIFGHWLSFLIPPLCVV